MPRHNELEKTWLPGPSRGTQTFNAPANLVIDYGRHVATISGRGGSGNNPGATYSILYNTNYNLVYPQANQPEVSRPIVNYNTNYNLAYPVATQPEVSRPINGYNVNYNIAYPATPGPPNNNIVYTTNYNSANVADTYGVNYNLAYPANYNIVYPATYNVVYPIQYNIAYPVSYNVVYPIQYNIAYPVTYNVAYPATYNVAYPIANQPVAGVDWFRTWSVDGFAYLFSEEPIEVGNSGPGGPNTPLSSYGSNPNLPSSPEIIGYFNFMPDGQSGELSAQYSLLGTNYNTNYNTAYPVSYNTVYPISYNVVYPESYNIAYPVSYNVVYPVNYNAAYPVTYNVAYPITGYNVVGVFSGYNTNYNIVNSPGNQPEVSRPITGYNVLYNIVYPPGNSDAIYNIVYETNYNTVPVAATYGANYNIVYQTNYNTVPVPANTPEASRPIIGYSPGAPGTPTTVLGVYFPGGSVGLVAPYVPETVVQYWDYPDFQTHPVSVPSGGEIVVKLE
jgi:hypothetical protein